MQVTEQDERKADTIFINGKIFTVNPDQPWAKAVAIKKGRFVGVSTSNEEILAQFGGSNETEGGYLGNKFVMPGIIDAHIRALNGADDLANLQIQQRGDPDAMLAEIKAYADNNPNLAIIRGSAWNLGVLPNDNPHKALLDAIVPDRPVFLYSQSGHSAWLNSKALEMAGITKDSPITKNFTYSKDPGTGEPTGQVDEYAIGHVEKILPPTSPERLLPGICKIQKMLHSSGITTVKLAEGRLNWAQGAALLEEKHQLTLPHDAVVGLGIALCSSFGRRRRSICPAVEGSGHGPVGRAQYKNI
ncbi:amidohydrolase [Seminavis robusta]|uniref:Amidohydrolase n=1 Tax=Seminavis robusta TaxID=568900 RepID=A0A9N8EMH3_9STRA|nr:amidohydrolase [Seminavis robusta]|eukprot:Sro1227_g254330.1 amidohydrolase (302) ;mRNA; f:25881-26786